MTEEKAFESFKSLLHKGALEGFILFELVNAYKYNQDFESGLEGYETREALRKVIRYYSTDEEYNKFCDDMGIKP